MYLYTYSPYLLAFHFYIYIYIYIYICLFPLCSGIFPHSRILIRPTVSIALFHPFDELFNVSTTVFLSLLLLLGSLSLCLFLFQVANIIPLSFRMII